MNTTATLSVPSLPFLRAKVISMNGTSYFLIIAVERYQSKKISNVNFAEEDAKGLVKAWQDLSYDPEDFVVLLNAEATKTAIEAHLKKIAAKAMKDDRIVIFFAGHGCAPAGDNMIVPVDAQMDLLPETCISINKILGYLKKAESERNLLFLDCCHSGFEPGENIRSMTSDFSVEDLVMKLKDEVYCVGFASCKSNQESIGHPKIKHGVWTHFLIEALSGNADEDLYESNALLSVKLQTYLRKETSEFVKKYRTDGVQQTPMSFGSFSDRFVIENLKSIFEARDAARKAAAFNMTSIIIFDTESGAIKNLPGFKKGVHRVPDMVGPIQNRFVQNSVRDLVKEEIDEMGIQIKEGLSYTRTEMKVECEEGDSYGAIETPDFTYSVEITQSLHDPKEYIIKRSLLDVTNPEIINDADFNQIFAGHFRELSFIFSNHVNIDKLIDRIEAMGRAAGVKLKYNPRDTSRLCIIFPNSDNEIVIEPHAIYITIPRAASPAQLVDAYKDTNRLLEVAKIKLIEGAK